jgi:glycosyltransferase involved in cell wall biosynthesis
MLVKDLIRQRNTLVKCLWIALIERRNIEHAAGIHLTAALELRELEKFGFALPATRLIANGITMSSNVSQDQRLGADVALALQKRPFVLYLGRLNWKKGLDKLIGAVATEPRLRLVIAGNDDEGYCEQLRRWIAENGMGSRTSVLPRVVSGTDKAALLANAAVFALPSVSENFGNAALEAMAAGCPVLISEGVGLAAIVQAGNAGIVARPGQFGAALARLVDEPALRETMGRNARHVAAAKFGWAMIAAEMESFYEEVRRDVARSAGQAVP